MLAKSISYSLQVSRLSIEAQLLFTWMIAHADDDGRLSGEAEHINFLVVPSKRWTKAQTESYLKSISDAGLIYLWSENGAKYIEFPNWTKHQQIRKDRYTPSHYPPYPKRVVNQSTTNVLPNGNHTTTQLSKVEKSENEVNQEKIYKGEKEFEEKPLSQPLRPLLSDKYKEVLAKRETQDSNE